MDGGAWWAAVHYQNRNCPNDRDDNLSISLCQKLYLIPDDPKTIPKKQSWSKVIKGTSLFGGEFRLQSS